MTIGFHTVTGPEGAPIAKPCFLCAAVTSTGIFGWVSYPVPCCVGCARSIGEQATDHADPRTTHEQRQAAADARHDTITNR